jgi:CheY-like chemotaxis protein
MKHLNNYKIFIAEDNFLSAHVLEEMLEGMGNFKIISFTSTEECMQILGHNPDLIILDYHFLNGEKTANGMHSMNGMAALERIKQQQPGIPVIILAAQQDVQVAADLLKGGAYDYIEKRDRDRAMEKLLFSVQRALNL